VSPFVIASVRPSVIVVHAPPFLLYSTDTVMPPIVSNNSVPVPVIVRVADVTGDDADDVVKTPLNVSAARAVNVAMSGCIR
jgi:hypothetical protein